MGLKGDLISSDLSNVFQMLAMNRKRGRLVVQDQGNLLRKRRLYIEDNQVALVDPPPKRPLDGHLVQSGCIDNRQLRDVRERAARYGQPAVQLMINSGWISKEQIQATARMIQEEEILEIFLWRNVSFSLDEGHPPPAGSLFFSLDRVIMEAARRQDEWRHMMGTFQGQHAIFAPNQGEGDPGRQPLAPAEELVLDHVNGIRGPQGIMKETGLSRYFVDLALHALEERGLIRRVGLAALIETGDCLIEGGDMEEGVCLFLAALRFDRKNITLHKRLAAAYLQQGRLAKGAAHYRFCAQCLLEAGHRREALTIYEHVLKLLPTDFRALERCLELLAQEGGELGRDDREVLRLSRKLLNFYMDAGRQEAALRVAQHLKRLRPADEELLETLARLKLRLGLASEATRDYLGLAEACFERGELRRALAIYRTMTALGGREQQIHQARVDEIQCKLAAGRRHAATGRLALLALLGAALLWTGAWFYSTKASSALEALEALKPATRAEVLNLAARFGKLAGSYPLTRAARLARQAEKRWIKRAREIQGEQEQHHQVLQDRQRRASALAARESRLALDRLKSGNLPEARKAFLKALSLGEGAGGLWPGRAQAKKNLRDITSYLAEGRKLLQSAQAAEQAGQVEQAHALFLKLMQNYGLSPQAATLRIPARIVTSPAGALISEKGGGLQGRGPWNVKLPARGHIVLRVQARGFRSREVRLALPLPHKACSIILDRLPQASLSLGEPLAFLARLRPGLVAAIGPGGRVFMVDTLEAKVVGRHEPLRIASITCPPAVSAGGLLTLAVDGTGTLMDSGGREIWHKPLLGPTACPLAARAAGENFVVAGEEGELLAVQGERGVSLWHRHLARRLAAVRVTGEWLAVLTRDRRLLLLDAARGSRRGEIAGNFEGNLAELVPGEVVLFQRGAGVVSVALESRQIQTLLPLEGVLEAGPAKVGPYLLAAVQGRGLWVRGESQRERWISLGEPIVSILEGCGKRAVLRTASGRLLVTDLEQGRVLWGYGGAQQTFVDPVCDGKRLVTAGAQGKLALLDLR